MRIIHAANFSLFPKNPLQSQQFALPYTVDRAVSHGLTRNRHDVFDFPVEDAIRRYRRFWSGRKRTKDTVNALLSEAVRRWQADWLILGHAMAILPATLRAIRKHSPDIKISQWWVDPLSPQFADRRPALRDKLPYLDALFITTSPQYLRQDMRHHADKIKLLPNPCDSAVHTGKSFERTDYRHDILYIGRPDPARKILLDTLNTDLSDLRMGIYGTDKSNELGGTEYPGTISASKIAINFNRFNDIPLYSSDRIAHLTGNGAMTLSARIPGYRALYSDDEVVYFDDMKDLCEKARYYLANDDDRRRIARNGWQRTHRDYNERRIAAYMEKICFGGEEKFPWEELS